MALGALRKTAAEVLGDRLSSDLNGLGPRGPETVSSSFTFELHSLPTFQHSNPFWGGAENKSLQEIVFYLKVHFARLGRDWKDF